MRQKAALTYDKKKIKLGGKYTSLPSPDWKSCEAKFYTVPTWQDGSQASVVEKAMSARSLVWWCSQEILVEECDMKRRREWSQLAQITNMGNWALSLLGTLGNYEEHVSEFSVQS